MTLEELWKLFPIFLTEHKNYWKDWYAEERAILKNLLPFDLEFHHIGSTAINNIRAKPIIDILIAVKDNALLSAAAEILQQHNYIVMSSTEKRISLNKGYTENGFAEKVFHIHLRRADDIDEIYFRDYLNSHPVAAKEYERLKLHLAEKYKYNRDAYTQAKTEFVNKYTNSAKQNLLKI